MEVTTLDSMDYTKEVALCQLHRTIKYADVRCASSAEVIRKVLDTTDDDERSAYISRLLELKLKWQELKLLQRAATTLARRSEKAPTALKTRLDRTLLRIVRMLPPNLATSFAEPYICHTRKARREWAYSALRNKRVPLRVARGL